MVYPLKMVIFRSYVKLPEVIRCLAPLDSEVDAHSHIAWLTIGVMDVDDVDDVDGEYHDN